MPRVAKTSNRTGGRAEIHWPLDPCLVRLRRLLELVTIEIHWYLDEGCIFGMYITLLYCYGRISNEGFLRVP